MGEINFNLLKSALALGLGLISFTGLSQSEECSYYELKIANYEKKPSYKNGAFIENLGQLNV